MQIVKVGLMVALVIAMLPCGGCGVSDNQHVAELEQQARRYEQQLKDQRQQYEGEIKRKQVWFAIFLVVTNVGWFLAYRKKP